MRRLVCSLVFVVACHADAPDASDIVYAFLPGGGGGGQLSGPGGGITTEIPGYSYEVTAGTFAQTQSDVAVITLVDEDTQATDQFGQHGFAPLVDGWEEFTFSLEVADGSPPIALACRGAAVCWGAPHRRGSRARLEMSVNGGAPQSLGEIDLGEADAPNGGLVCNSREDLCGTGPGIVSGCVPEACECPATTKDVGIDAATCSDPRYPRRCDCWPM